PSRPLSRLATRLPPTSPLFPYTTLFRAPPRPRGPGRGRRYGSSASSSSARDREPAYGDGGGTPAGVRRDVGDVDPGRERRGVEGERVVAGVEVPRGEDGHPPPQRVVEHCLHPRLTVQLEREVRDRKSTRLNSSH